MLTRFCITCASLDSETTALNEPSDIVLEALVVDVEEEPRRGRTDRKVRKYEI